MMRTTLACAWRGAARSIHSGPASALYSQKYADRLREKAQEKGLDLEQLKTQAREEARNKERKEAATLVASFKKEFTPATTRTDAPQGGGLSNTRRDSSPVKPLSSILNLTKIVATPHTPSQISALWTAYHASRTNGTGRGYICASLSLDSYNAMVRVAKQHPVFVVPVPRESSQESQDPSAGESTAHEFFFLQWDFHPAPPAPSATDPNPIPFEPVTAISSSPLPEPSTVLFTPLQEYKLRNSFATPYLVLTFYTDISQSHGIVLLRGEITPSTPAAAQPGKETQARFLLNQVDAQLLAMGLQRFYLWGEGRKDGDNNLSAEMLLKRFHEEPEKFSWLDLIKSSNITA